MNIFEQIIYGLSAKMETPQGYGAFHLISFGIIIALTAVVCLTLGKASQKAEKILLMTVWAVLILWEAYRQLVYAAHFEETVYWDYQWESFPFQFCSSPLFLLPLAALPKNEKLRDAVRMFLASFSLFAGLAVMFYPNGAFSSMIGVSVQTMLHHGSMIILGVYLGGRLLREGKINCVVECTPMLGETVMELAEKLKAGETVPRILHPEETMFTEYDSLEAIAPRGY